MLTVFLFDERESEQVEDWRAALEGLADDQLLWLALRDPTEDEVAALQEALELGDENAQRLLEQPGRASLADAGERMHVTLYAAGVEKVSPSSLPSNARWPELDRHRSSWEGRRARGVSRARRGRRTGRCARCAFVCGSDSRVDRRRLLPRLRGCRERTGGAGCEGHVRHPEDVSDDLARLVELRRSIGTLRKALAPHREVVVALAHPELDALSTERSAEKFAALESRLTQALEAARESKESTFGSFDLLVARIGQRTNDIMKVLTLVTVVLLPSTVLAGIMGMNFQVGLFNAVWVFWVVIAAMLSIALLVLSVARSRRWI